MRRRNYVKTNSATQNEQKLEKPAPLTTVNGKPQITVNSAGDDLSLSEVLSLCRQVLPYTTADEMRGRVYRAVNYERALNIVREYVVIVDKGTPLYAGRGRA